MSSDSLTYLFLSPKEDSCIPDNIVIFAEISTENNKYKPFCKPDQENCSNSLTHICKITENAGSICGSCTQLVGKLWQNRKIIGLLLYPYLQNFSISEGC